MQVAMVLNTAMVLDAAMGLAGLCKLLLPHHIHDLSFPDMQEDAAMLCKLLLPRHNIHQLSFPDMQVAMLVLNAAMVLDAAMGLEGLDAAEYFFHRSLILHITFTLYIHELQKPMCITLL